MWDVVPARDRHVRYPPGWRGHVKIEVPAQDHHVRYHCVAWARENTWIQLKTTMLDPPWVAWTRENTWFQQGTTMYNTHLGGLYT